ncbi:hypothetical protein K9V56_023315 [Paucibacter aquatile]|nr:hypothetical protein [Paucibacter aquatile]WIV97905.1 hypothetical protein K9V56_023315 [Paucibacter aquatile]
MVAIQCVSQEIHVLAGRLEAGTVDDPAETEQLLVSYDLALEDLKHAYLVAQGKYGGLPPFEQLIQGRDET